MRTTRFVAAAATLAAFSCVGFANVARAADPAPAATSPAATPSATAAPAAAATTPVPADPVVGRVNGSDIHLSEVQEAAAQVPQEYRSMPMQVLFPMLLDQLIDRRAIADLAMKQGLDKDPKVQLAMRRAEQTALQNALISRQVGPQVTDEMVRARYQATIAGKPGAEEVHAAHILVPTEDEAKAIIAQLKAGADFTALAKQKTTDPSGKTSGGDLGFFKKGDMLPEFADVAFALKPGEISQVPVKTRYGWHVIKVLERRQAPAPTYEASRDELRQTMIQEAVQKIIKEARAGVTIVRYNPDGSVPKAADAVPPPAAQAPAAAAKP